MSSALDMSLEDLIKNNKKSGGGGGGRGGRGRGGGGGAGPGPSRRVTNRGANRANPYSMGKIAQAPDSAWQHDMFADQAGGFPAQQGGRMSSIETGTKLYISNLEYGVSNEDIKELFSEVGDLKRYSIHYDRSGRSKGTAEVVFSRRLDAVAAVKRYNNVQLDGKPMKIEIVGTNIGGAAAAAMPPAPNVIFSNPNGVPRGGQGRGGASFRPRGGRGSGRGSRGRGRGRGEQVQVSAEDLDAELENPNLKREVARELSCTLGWSGAKVAEDYRVLLIVLPGLLDGGLGFIVLIYMVWLA